MMQRGDFTASVRLLWISSLAVVIGMLCAVVAYVLIWLITLFTNLFYYQEFVHAGSATSESLLPAVQRLGLWSILVPVVGGLIIGLMARYGSERIRGHGIPEALEAILIGQSRMSPKVAVLKPLSSAVSIGSGGPFGAEGPIIMTGGACGSIIAQIFNLTSAERKTLLVAGAAGGMAATFNTPVAAVLLAVELLLFEWKPRSLIPVALAAAAAILVRPALLPSGPLFPVEVPDLGLHAHPLPDTTTLLSSVACGILAGVFATLLTGLVYAMEDLFHRLPVHWMWWPALGGLIVGVGGYFEPRALGVGYDIIKDLLHGGFAGHPALVGLVALMVVKCFIWSAALGSGTSGGVLAPLLIMGGALGALEGTFLPGGDMRLWALVGMASIMGGTMRAPFTGVVFALELTQDVNALPPLLIGSTLAYAVTVLMMKRSILTEKVARRGYHVSREYSVDPLEMVNVGDVMSSEVVTIPAAMPVHELLEQYFHGSGLKKHQAYPVVDSAGNILGVITRTNLLEEWVSVGMGKPGESAPGRKLIIAFDLIQREPVTAFAWEGCRTAAERMAAQGVGRLPVVSADDPRKIVGIVTRSDLLKARARVVQEEAKRERFINIHLPGHHRGEVGEHGASAP